MTDETIYQSVKMGTLFHEAIEETVKGKEIKMPAGFDFNDTDGTKRSEIRIKWWENPLHVNYKEISVEPLDTLPESQIDITLLKNADYYKEQDKPIFFGHYWLKGNPWLYRNNICCLDYSVAKNGHPDCYRFDGEKELRNEKFVFV